MEGAVTQWSRLPLIVAIGSLSFALCQTALAQKPDRPQITPRYNQSAEEQENDLAACSEIAKARTGIDPAKLAQSGPTNVPEAAGNAATPNSSSAPSAAGAQPPPEADSAASAADNDRRVSSIERDQQAERFRTADEACLRARGYIVNSESGTQKDKN
jgi:hypothetical protein